MAKRNTRTTARGGAKTPGAGRAQAPGDVNERLAVFAEQLGWMAGRLAAKADTLREQQAIGEHLASVRDGAASLLEQLRSGATSMTEKLPAVPGTRKAAAPAPPAAKPARLAKTAKGGKAAKTPVGATGRSGGVVDAPGKKHRTPPPATGGSGRSANQGRLRAPMPAIKTPRRGGRG